MSEIISPPLSWRPIAQKTAADLKAALSLAPEMRLISIKTAMKSGTRYYSAIAVQTVGLYWDWTEKMNPDVLKAKMIAEGQRLISLDCFMEGEQLWCAAVWIKNDPAIKWNWTFNKGPGLINNALLKENGKLTCVRTYQAQINPAPAALTQTFCAIWIESDGKPWGWHHDLNGSQLGDKLSDENGKLISIDNLDQAQWLQGQERYCAIWYENEDGSTWFWNNGLTAVALDDEFKKFCSYGMDLVPSGPDTYASIMYQFPQPASVLGAPLLDSWGSGSFKSYYRGFMETLEYGLKLKNVSGEEVSLERGLLMNISEGGFTWVIAEEATQNGAILGMPLSLPPGFNQNHTPLINNTSPPVNQKLLCIHATTDSGKSQWLLTQMLHPQQGFAPVAAIHVAMPAYIGVIEPLDAVSYSNGKVQVPLIGMIVNPTGEPMTLTRLHLKLTSDANLTLFEGLLPLSFLIDTDPTGKALNPPVKNDPVVNSKAPVPKFIRHLEVPRTFTSGKLRIEVNFQWGGNCFSDVREIQVGLPPDEGPLQPPVKGRWNWGNGSDGPVLHVHSWPEHRYGFDLGIKDVNGSFIKQGGDPAVNSDYYCYLQPVYAMRSGVVVYADFSNAENAGNKQDVLGWANCVIIQSGELYHAYFHFAPRKENPFETNPVVMTGDLLGYCGNSGGSSAPHLHVSAFKIDPSGFIRPVPMRFDFLAKVNGAAALLMPNHETEYIATW